MSKAAEAQVAGREVIFLEVQRIVGDVHLAIDAQQRAVGVDDQRGVVIDTRRAPLEYRAYNHDLQFARQTRKALAGGAGNGLRQVEQVGPFLAAEILRAEEFLHADNLRAFAGGFANAPLGFRQILVGVERAGHLDQAHAEFRHVHKSIVPAYDFY